MKKLFSVLLVLMFVLSLAAPAMAAGKTTITLSHTGTVTLSVGQTVQITATVSPAAPVTWTSKKAKVAAVDGNGKVTAIAEGSTTVIAKAGGKSAKVSIKVVDPNKPTKITFTQGKAATVNVGSTLQLGTALQPAGAKATLTWKSSKPKIATVDATGKVTPVAEGKAKITVTTHNKKKATITVTVVDPYKPTGLTLSQGKTATLTAGNTLQLSPVLAPATAKATLTYKSSKASVATVDTNGRVTAIGKGKAKITVQAANNKKAKAVITVTVNAGSIDLLKYLGMNNRTAGAQLGFKFAGNANATAADFALVKGKASLSCHGSLEYGLVDGCWLKGKCDYNAAGVTVGMSKTEAVNILTNAGYKYNNLLTQKEQEPTYSKPYLNADIDITLTVKNGTVTQVYAFYWGTFPWDDDGYRGL